MMPRTPSPRINLESPTGLGTAAWSLTTQIALTHTTKAYYREMDGGARLEQIRRGSEKELLA